MAETKYGKYIVTELKRKFSSPYEGEYKPGEQTEILALDDGIIKGAFHVECVWFWPERAKRTEPDVKPHKHDYDEVLAMFGTNLEDPSDLCGEVEVWLGDEKHVINKSCIIYLPKGLQHGPFRFTRLDKPVFHFGICMAKKYI
jgi:hypothetical protein